MNSGGIPENFGEFHHLFTKKLLIMCFVHTLWTNFSDKKEENRHFLKKFFILPIPYGQTFQTKGAIFLPVSNEKRNDLSFCGKKEAAILSKEKAAIHPSNEAMERQTEYDKATKTYTSRCGVCGKAKSLKKGLLLSHFSAIQKLRLNFNFFDTCGKWVCGDCFLIDDGNGNGIGICTACAEERGITGLTGAQFEEAWPRIESVFRSRIQAAKRAMNKEQAETSNGQKEQRENPLLFDKGNVVSF
jgi:hypothetical protein